jgi:group I intron endonuclease
LPGACTQTVIANSKMYGIYQILNKKIGDCYIGSAVNLKKRTPQHIFFLRNSKSKHVHLQRAWNKYGEENFEIVFLENVDDKETLTIREQYYIDLLKLKYFS